MAGKISEWPKGTRTHNGLLPKRLSRDAVLSLGEIKALPDVDTSGLFPTPFLAVLHQHFRRYQRNATAQHALVSSINLQGSARIDAITFVIALSAFRAWRGSEEQKNVEKLLRTTIKRCQRRAKNLRLRSYHEKDRLTALRRLLQRQTVAKWQAYVTYGFALKFHPDNATPLVLEEFRDVLTRHVYDRDPTQVKLGKIGPAPLNSIRANVFRFRADNKEQMAKLSLQHFDALQQQFTRLRGTTPLYMRLGNWK